ncbi:MAG: prolipoprotein diacylglyceryl transferase [Acidimicrobiales bacterium]|nr:MAG: prolipoprotein diacylglyceryl transferase [Acidimicrobiales bacterium]
MEYLASFPSPSVSIWYIGPVPIRAYALCIVLGVALAVFITDRRLRARGAPAGAALDVGIFAIPAGIIGARLYHIFTTPEPYFGAHGHLINVFKVWEGGLGIWGGVVGGALGAWFGCRQLGIPLRVFADALAPGLVLAQAVGRFGNWFNQELYGRPTDLPWALEIDIDHRLKEYLAQATYHPTFLYESLWCVGVAALIWWAERRFNLGGGRTFALYAAVYVAGRAWIEYLRIDEAHLVLGLRLNEWTCLVVFLLAMAYFVLRGGPPERLEVDENGKVRLLPAEVADQGSSSTDTTNTEVADFVNAAADADATASGKDDDTLGSAPKKSG